MEREAGSADNSVSLGTLSLSDEWKEARNVINNCDSRVAEIRKYGLGFVAGLLAAQGLIEFPLKTSSEVVPDSVKLSILVASYVLIIGIFDIDRKVRKTQKAAARRACMLEGRSGLHSGLTQLISQGYGTEGAITSSDVIYLVLVIATTILGVAVLGLTSLSWSPDLVLLLSAALLTGGVVYFFGHSNRLLPGV